MNLFHLICDDLFHQTLPLEEGHTIEFGRDDDGLKFEPPIGCVGQFEVLSGARSNASSLARIASPDGDMLIRAAYTKSSHCVCVCA